MKDGMHSSSGRKANGQEHHTHITADPAAHSRTEVFREISQIKMTSIVCTPARLVDLLEHFDGMFALRETTFSFGARGSKSSVETIHLQPHELAKLGGAIPRALEESGGTEQDSQRSFPQREPQT